MSSLRRIVFNVLIVLLVILLGGWIIFFISNTAGYFSSPSGVANFQCPAGSTLKETTQEPYPGAGYQNTTVRCLDANGSTVPPLPGEARPPSRFRFYYPPALLFMTLLVIAALIWYAARSRRSGS